MSSGFPVYTLSNLGVSISTAITVLQYKAGVNGPGEILRCTLTQQPAVTAAQVSAYLVKTVGAATVTAAAAGVTLFKNNGIFPTTDASLGTSATGYTATVEGATPGDRFALQGAHIANGFIWLPTPDEQVVVGINGFIALKFGVAPPSATWMGELVWREYRGLL